MIRTLLRPRFRAAARMAAVAVAAVLAVAMIPSAASAATGSYSVTNWTGQPSLYNRFAWSIGPTLSPPAGIPSNAVITDFSAYASWSANAPSGFHYENAICFASTSDCRIFNGTGTANSWAIPKTPLIGSYNASTTQLIYGGRVTDGTNPSIWPAINPPTYFYPNHGIVIYYSY